MAAISRRSSASTTSAGWWTRTSPRRRCALVGARARHRGARAGRPPGGGGARLPRVRPALRDRRWWPGSPPPACDVVDLGVVPTPLTYFAAATLPVDGLVMITGSPQPARVQRLQDRAWARPRSTATAIQALRRLHRGAATSRAGPGKVDTHDIVTPYRALRPAEPEARPPQAEGGRRRRQRHRRRHRGAALPVAGRRGGAALLRDGRPLPQPPPRPDGGEEPRGPEGQGAGDRRRPGHRLRRRRRPGRRRRREGQRCSGATSS